MVVLLALSPLRLCVRDTAGIRALSGAPVYAAIRHE